MFVAWHPSGLIDPVLLHASLPGKLSILAKHTLFNLPILGRLFSAAGALPIYRALIVMTTRKPRKKCYNARKCWK